MWGENLVEDAPPRSSRYRASDGSSTGWRGCGCVEPHNTRFINVKGACSSSGYGAGARVNACDCGRVERRQVGDGNRGGCEDIAALWCTTTAVGNRVIDVAICVEGG